ncbi:MAG: helix-turn-helix domain-containing protein [Burkholderiales bacterium]
MPASRADDIKSELPFARKGDKQPLPVRAHARIHATSKTYGWDGLYVEVGENQGWEVRDLVPVGHYIAINRLPTDFHFDALQGERWVSQTMPPGSLWIQPANQAFSFNVHEQAQWCGAVVQPAILKALLGSDSAVEPVIGLQDDTLGPAMQALCAEVLRGGPSGRRFAEGMLAVIGTQLLRLFGEAHSAPKGGITGRQRSIVTEYVDTHLTATIAVADLAACAGLSEAHFARAFKQTVGVAPHRFVIERRLERGKRMLADTEDSIAQIAADCGFADQAHFSRAFSQAFGVSPSALRKSFG